MSTKFLQRPAPVGPALAARGFRQWGTPTRLRAGTLLIAVLTATLALITVTTAGSLGTGVSEIGNTTGPEVEHTAALLGTLSDLDAQVANLLLAGNDPAFASTAHAASTQFTTDQQSADTTLRQAIAAASSDPTTVHTIQTLLDGLATYEGDVAQVRLLEAQSNSPAGRPNAAVLAAYDQATDLMRTTLLPSANALITSNDNALNGTYSAQRGSAQETMWLLVGIGLLLLTALIGLQVYLARQFRRLLNPFLAAAALAALILGAFSVALMQREPNDLYVAKADAFDSVIALTRAQAASSEANADESRWLVDPARAAQYQQAFQDESQQLLTLSSSTSVDDYDSALSTAVAAIPNPPPPFTPNNVPFGGYFGTELNNITFDHEGPDALATVQAYQAYEKADRVLRAQANSGDLTGAITFDTGTGPTQSDGIYANYLTKLQAVTTINTNAFASSMASASNSLNGWTYLPILGGLLIIGLAVQGVRPRLAEYH